MSFRHILYSLLLHLAVAVLLVISFDMAPVMIKPPPPSGNIVSAVTVDSKQVQAELNRLKKRDEQKQKHQQQLKKQAEAAERKRRSEEKRLAELKKKQQEQEKQNQQEQQRLAELKKQQTEAEQKRKVEEEKQRQAEAAKQKAEAEQKRIEEQQRKAEEEAKRKAAQEALQKQLAEEQRKRDAEQAKRDMAVISQYGEKIKQAIRQEFNTVGLPQGLSCVFVIRMIPGGQVVESHIEKSSGNPVFDRRAETALSKASPLPVPGDPRLFEKMREIRLTFEPKS